MNYNVEITPAAQKHFKKLSSTSQDKILQAIEKLAINPRPNGYKKLISKLECYRVKVSDYRIIYSIHDKTVTILILDIGHRRDIYK